MPANDMVTIVTPVYNTAPYLRACLDSILAQTYTHWQLVLIDDGSTDGSSGICDEYAAADPRIEVVHTPNGGVARARNTGIDRARGEWLTFVDSDDITAPGYLADMLAAATPGCDLVVSGWVKDGVTTSLPGRTVPREDFLSLFGGFNYGYILGKLYRASLFGDTALRFDEDVCWAEDTLFFCRVLPVCRSVTVIPAVNYTYVTHADSSINRLHSYEKEMRGFTAAKEVTAMLYDKISPQVTLSPYAFLVRAIMALRRSGVDRAERMRRLRAVEFDPYMMRSRERGLRSRLYYYLVVHRRWLLLDLLTNM